MLLHRFPKYSSLPMAWPQGGDDLNPDETSRYNEQIHPRTSTLAGALIHPRTRQQLHRVTLQLDTQDIHPASSGHPDGSNPTELQYDPSHHSAHEELSPLTSLSVSPVMENRPSGDLPRPRSATINQLPQASHPPLPERSPSMPMLSSATRGSPAPSSAAQVAQSPVAATSGTGGAGGGSSSGKRKRSRVTPEQLAYLEHIFSYDRSPGAAKRKDISERLGMQERQTQIWYQNRRAKAKMMESRGRGSGGARSGQIGSPMSPPDLGMASDAELQQLIHAGEPITIIQCSDLTIGTWHRIAAKTGSHDLIAYTAEGSQVLTWYIFSEGFGFRMDLPFVTIERVDLTTANTHLGSALATITLTQAPNFYMEEVKGGERSWKKCTDWTEGMQASTMLRHEVIGSYAQLYQALSRFPGRRSPAPSPPPGAVVLRAPHAPYQSNPYASAMGANFSDPTGSASPLHQSPLHQSPPVDLSGSPAAPSPGHFAFPQHVVSQGRQRSYSGPAAYQPEALAGSPVGYPPSPFSPYPQTESPTLDYNLTTVSSSQYQSNNATNYSPYSMVSVPAPAPSPTGAAQQQQHHHSGSLSDFAPVAISQIGRPFSSHGVPQSQLGSSTSMMGSPSHHGMFMHQHVSPIPEVDLSVGSELLPMGGATVMSNQMGGSYMSYGDGSEPLLSHTQLSLLEHPLSHTPPPHPHSLHRTSSLEPSSSLSGALGEYPSTNSPHSGGSPYHYQ